MRSNPSWVITIFALLVSIHAPMARAQVQGKAYVPFAFIVDGQTMAAGNYEIGSPGDRVLSLWNRDSRQRRLLIASVYVFSNRVERPRLVFRKLGDQYFLTEIWDGRSDAGIIVPSSKSEKEALASEITHASPGFVSVAMK